jgi:hypothetical protein
MLGYVYYHTKEKLLSYTEGMFGVIKYDTSNPLVIGYNLSTKFYNNLTASSIKITSTIHYRRSLQL